ncbi:hypothetical protein [Thermomicrobium sp.]
MRRWWRRDRDRDERSAVDRPTEQPERPVREAERRRLARLYQRREELRYDLMLAEQALQPENRWTERLRELDAAIADLEEQRKALESVPPVLLPYPLPSVPVEVRVDLGESLATVELEISGVVLRWVEEVDWAERGHQLAPARLRRVEGELGEVLAAVGYREPSPELLATLAASADLVAADALESVRRRQVWTEIRLDDLARPCPACGGWRDLRDRCPTCAARAWQAQHLVSERNRLRRERDEVFRDWQRTRDRLPIIQRQLAEVEADIRQLEEKGVRLSSDG